MSGLFDKICHPDTLYEAWLQVRKKNSQGGLDDLSPSDLEGGIRKRLSRLSDDLKTQRYAPVPYAKGAIPKFNEANEWRTLSLPTVIDKVVQEAFVSVVNPIFSRNFLDCSYAYRKGKGAIKAIKRVEHILHSNRCHWAATLDIDNFFDTLDHQWLLQEVKAKIGEPKVIQLLSLWLKAGIISRKGNWREPDEGIAQGSVVSPLCSNIYLHPLDLYAVNQGLNYIRYSDNFILLSSGKDEIYLAYENVKSFLEDRLRLKLNDNPYPFKNIGMGFTFLGIYFYKEQRSISTAKQKKIFQKINWLTDRIHQTDPEVFLRRLNKNIVGKRRYYGFINPVEQFKSFDDHLFKRLKFLCIHFHEIWVST